MFWKNTQEMRLKQKGFSLAWQQATLNDEISPAEGTDTNTTYFAAT